MDRDATDDRSCWVEEYSLVPCYISRLGWRSGPPVSWRRIIQFHYARYRENCMARANGQNMKAKNVLRDTIEEFPKCSSHIEKRKPVDQQTFLVTWWLEHMATVASCCSRSSRLILQERCMNNWDFEYVVRQKPII